MTETIDVLIEKLKDKKEARITDIDGVKRVLPVGKFVFLQASEYPEKVFVLQEIIWRGHIPEGVKLLRFGYHIIGKKPKRQGKWVWGQFCPFITDGDMRKLIDMAKDVGIL